MSNEKKPTSDVSSDAATDGEINEEQLESVAGGILIGLNQPAFKEGVAGHKDLKGQLDVQLGKKGTDAYTVKLGGNG